ncbi:hypothetical protein RPW65_16660 [Pseudomonas sp. NyZ704]|nr:hypothetical protein RPW65_16660 [Pseudomonas sp. NyZ704]
MTLTPTVKEYFAALERLKQNKPDRIEKGSQINKDTVALEAGRKRGSIRSRPGFETLIAAIKTASSEPSTVGTKRRIQENPRQTAQIEMLKRDLDIARSRYMSLLFLNAEMAKTIRKLGGEVPQIGGVSVINIDPDSTDVPF